MFASTVVGFSQGISWGFQLFLQAPWKAVYTLWSHFAVFTYGDRLNQATYYAVASGTFGWLYIVIGGLLLWGIANMLGGKKDKASKEETSISVPPQPGLKLNLKRALLFLILLFMVIGAAAFLSGGLSLVIAYIASKIR